MKISAPQRSQHASRRSPALRISPIATACSTLLFAMGAVHAQQASLDAVTVTGIRHAIETAIAAKRNSDSIVEVVTSEDIGKLPESSVAESLARLPGVTGQRGASGRTDVISIRGLSPNFGGALLNGREVVSSNDGRAVEFDQFPSELTSSLVVYKTPDAALIGQGLSGTVDIKTLKPLDLRGRQISVNANANTNSNNTPVAGGGSTTGKRFSVSFIDQFADNTIGLSLGYAHLDSPAQTISNRVNEWTNPYNNSSCIGAGAQGWCPTPALGLPLSINGGGADAKGYAAFPQRFEVFAETKSNVRDGLMATLEFKPNRDLHSQLDLFYSKFDSRTVSTGFQAELYNGIWNGPANERPLFSNVKTEQLGGNTIVTAGDMAQIANGVINNTSTRTDQTSAFGWNTALKLGDKWTAVADLSYSRNVRDENFYEIYAAPYADGKYTRGSFSFQAPGTNPNDPMRISPIGTSNLANAAAMALGDPLGYVWNSGDTGWAGPHRNPHTEDEIKALRLSGKRAMDGVFSSLDFGVNFGQRDKVIQKNQYSIYMAKDGAGNWIRTIPAAFVRAPADLSAYGVPTVMSIDAEALMNSGTYRADQAFWLRTTNEGSVNEKITTAYVKADIDTDLGGIAVRGNVGTQLVRTSQNSTGWSYIGGSDTENPSNLRQVSGGKTYTDWLPSLNLVFDLKNDMIARVGVARTMARPEMNDLRAGFSAKLKPGTAGATSGAATWSTDTAGNPELDPWRANSFDISLEKYFGKRSYLAAAMYHKNLLSYIFNKQVQRDFTDVPYDHAYTPTTNLVTVNAPANGTGGNVQGLELSAALEGKLLTPMLDGFGVVASGSKVRSSIHANEDVTQPLAGLSGTTASLTAYYEKGGFSARVNETYRSAFLAMTRDWAYNPTFTKTGEERLVNLQFGYAFEAGAYKGLSLTLQLNNVTDAALVTYKSVGAQGFNPDPMALVPYEVRKFGRGVGFGASYKF